MAGQLYARYTPKWGPAVESGLGAYHEMARLKLARMAQEETERRNREIDARASRTADRMELRDTVDYEFKQGENIRVKKQRAAEHIVRGDFAAAKAELADVPFVKDGKIGRGLQFDEVGAPPPVPVPQSVQDNPNYILREPYKGSQTGGDPGQVPMAEGQGVDPQATDLMARALREGRERITAETKGDKGLQGDYRQYLEDAAKQKVAAEQYGQNRQFKISGGPAGSEEVVSETGARAGMVSNRNRDADEFATSVAPDPNPWVQEYAPTLTELIRGGGMDRKEAAKYLFMLRSQDMSAEQKKAAMAQAMERAKVMAGAVGRGKTGQQDFTAGEHRSERTMKFMEQAIKDDDLHKRMQYQGQFKGLISALQSGIGADQKLSLIASYRAITGDNRLSDQDRNFVQQSMGTRFDDLETKFDAWRDNKLSPGQVTQLVKALRRASGAMDEINKRWASQQLEATNDTSAWDPRIVRSYLARVGLLGEAPSDFGTDKPPVPRKGKHGGAIDDDMKFPGAAGKKVKTEKAKNASDDELLNL